ncbi:kinase-like protein [Trichoderma citrinoviride]|uniref:EKC/KEOPS complex subunit BUD32 n=1 Tax=Trichoderma citrinoviride TaxID=58853 RepID=A0A2T4BJC1_9HYPO|nr:kinase-like protein [Trichoderma citrinoviride]PTB69400.1 kinase-like protein [Trichoderma citrinoviride]
MEIIDSFEVMKKVDGKFQIYVKVIVRQDDDYYIGKWRDRRQLPDKFSQLEDAKMIPTKDRGPVMNPQWTTAPQTGDFYVKKPDLQDYVDPKLEERVEHEVKMCELIKRQTHPNLASYYGCLSDQGRVVGICFKKYQKTLLESVNPGRLSKRHFMESGRPLVEDHMKDWITSIRSAVDHLHTLGLVHNDITPANVMIDEHGSPILIDFGGLCRVGESLRTVKRTYGWYDEAVTEANKQGDIDALAEIEAWLFDAPEDLRFSEW